MINSLHEVGGESPLQEESLVGRFRPMEWDKVIVVVVVLVGAVESYYFFINSYC